MSELKIKCPSCGKSIELTEAVTKPFLEEMHDKYQQEFDEKEDTLKQRRKALEEDQKEFDKSRKAVDKEREALAKQREELEEQVEDKVKEKRAEITKDEARKAKQKYDDKVAKHEEEMDELREAMEAKDTKIAEAQKIEKDFRRKERELNDKIREIDLEVEKRLGEQAGTLREKAKAESDEQNRLRIAEKEKTINDLQAKLQDAIRKSEQGSQQLQGDVQELDLEGILKLGFPHDTIERVPKGVHGGDILQRVIAPGGMPAGTILWEAKRTKAWNVDWTGKLRADQREAKAEIAVILSAVLPKGVEPFGEVDRVWVTSPPCILPVAAVLRQGLIDLATVRRASEGKQSKVELVYEYLTGPMFRQQLEAIRDAFMEMHIDLAREKVMIQRQWQKREKQIANVIAGTVGMYGQIQGIVGRTMPAIEGLDLPELPEGDNGLTESDDESDQ